MAIATCSACLAAGKLRWHCKNELSGIETTSEYSLQMSARRIVQRDFSILPCEASETVIVVCPRTTKTLL